jgi:antitoxin component YwqK of YwqJK toxin-antitoxin module
VFEGNWRYGKKEGTGKIFSDNRVLKFEGNFKEDLKNGFGIEFDDNGKIFCF